MGAGLPTPTPAVSTCVCERGYITDMTATPGDAPTSRSVLVVEDEENLLEALRYNLQRDGYSVLTAADGETGVEMARQDRPDLIILDLMLPGLDGMDACRIIRRGSDVPILMLTAKTEETDKVVGLELGADDYVSKPFSMRELMARVGALLRRAGASSTPGDSTSAGRLRSGDLEVDVSRHIATLAGETVELTPREFDLLALFLTNRGRALSRDQILDSLWGRDYVGDSRTVDVHVRWLRKKIESAPGNPKRIVTVRGLGYRFEA